MQSGLGAAMKIQKAVVIQTDCIFTDIQEV